MADAEFFCRLCVSAAASAFDFTCLPTYKKLKFSQLSISVVPDATTGDVIHDEFGGLWADSRGPSVPAHPGPPHWVPSTGSCFQPSLGSDPWAVDGACSGSEPQCGSEVQAGIS